MFQVLPARVYDSAIRSVLLQAALLVAFLAAAEFAPTAPLSSLGRCLRSVVAPSSWFYDACLVGGLVAFCLLLGARHALVPSFRRSRASAVLDLLEPRALTSVAAVGGIGAVLVRCYLGMLGGIFNPMVVPCDIES